MTPDQALKKYIDRKIPLELQSSYVREIGFIKGGWKAAEQFLGRKVGTSSTSSLKEEIIRDAVKRIPAKKSL